MSFSDLVLLDSNFTKREVITAFPTLALLQQHEPSDIDGTNTGTDNHQQQHGHMQVLYPAIDLKGFIPPNFEQKQRSIDNQTTTASTSGNDGTITRCPIVSLNRFERKKNIEILLRAYAELHRIVTTTTTPSSNNNDNGLQPPAAQIPPLIIAGGYDPNNHENLEYLTELRTLASSLHIAPFTSFRTSVSDNERAALLQSALCVVYTPFREHFGIVPLEAMYAGSAVVALKSGGAMEMVVHGETGILVDLEGDGAGEEGALAGHVVLAGVILRLVRNPEEAIEMGRKGHEHVKKNFGLYKLNIF